MPAFQTTRAATPGDYNRFLAFFAELGLRDDPVPDRAKWEAEWLPFTFFLEQEGTPVGYAVVHVLGGLGYVFHLVTDPAHRRLGVGGALMENVAARLRAAGCTHWSLNVKVDNAPALRLYERCGMTVAYRSVVMSIDWAHVAGLPRDGGDVAVRAVDPAEDALLEAAFQFPAGRFAQLRRSQGRVLLRLVDQAHPGDLRVGVACFDPAFPAAFAFRAARPSLAAPLLHGIRAHARPDDVRVRIVVESDDALVAALSAAGAEVKLILLHMVGDLPVAKSPA